MYLLTKYDTISPGCKVAAVSSLSLSLSLVSVFPGVGGEGEGEDEGETQILSLDSLQPSFILYVCADQAFPRVSSRNGNLGQDPLSRSLVPLPCLGDPSYAQVVRTVLYYINSTLVAVHLVEAKKPWKHMAGRQGLHRQGSSSLFRPIRTHTHTHTHILWYTKRERRGPARVTHPSLILFRRLCRIQYPLLKPGPLLAHHSPDLVPSCPYLYSGIFIFTPTLVPSLHRKYLKGKTYHAHESPTPSFPLLTNRLRTLLCSSPPYARSCRHHGHTTTLVVPLPYKHIHTRTHTYTYTYTPSSSS